MASDFSKKEDSVDQSRHYLNRELPDKALVGLILEHFDKLDEWSSDLLIGSADVNGELRASGRPAIVE